MTADFYTRLLLGCLVIVGVWTAFGKDMIFGWLGDVLDTRLPFWMCKPLFECPPCMASVHGTWVWFITGGHWTGWPIYVIALCGLMKLVAHNLLK